MPGIIIEMDHVPIHHLTNSYLEWLSYMGAFAWLW